MPTGTGRPKVQLREVSVTFIGHREGLLALDRISLDIDAGEFPCLVGPSGCGKSTLLRVCAGLVRQSSGEATIHADRPGTPPSPPWSSRSTRCCRGARCSRA